MTLHDRLNALPDVTATEHAPLAPLTTYKLGGPARHLVVPATLEGLQAALSALQSVGMPWAILGNGSNVLVADAGFAGAVIKLGDGFATTTLERGALDGGRHRLTVGAALSITKLLRLAKRELLSGLEALGGVPATVGGAVKMNAGTRLGELGDSLVAAQIVRPNAGPEWIATVDLGLGYRHSELPKDAVVTAARFAVGDADEGMRERLDEVLAYRKSTQPLQYPSCGSVFANPPGDAAGRLIEASGLKGARVGGAQVSEQHANWIVNTGDATAADVRALIGRIRAEVLAQHGVTLRPEVQLFGDWRLTDRFTAPGTQAEVRRG